MPKSFSIQLHDVRLSLIWTTTFSDLLCNPPSPDAPMAFLGRRSMYAEKFEQILAAPKKSRGWAAPWPPSGRIHFWTYYLKLRCPHTLSGNTAWNALVPLRTELPIKVRADDMPGRFMLEGFAYPFGIGLIISVYCQDTYKLPEMTQILIDFVNQRNKLKVTWPQEGRSISLPIRQLANEHILMHLREVVLGQKKIVDMLESRLFTVLTVVKATGTEHLQYEPVVSGGDIHRALHALASWSTAWKSETLPALDTVIVPPDRLKQRSEGSALYTQKRGRALWFPGLFAPSTGKIRTLACYHRNSTLAALQTEMLAGMVIQVSEQLDLLSHSEPYHDCVRHATQKLRQLYVGSPSTYRSYSLRLQIEQNGWCPAINRLCDYFNMVPLS
jgi:hypothetical protein